MKAPVLVVALLLCALFSGAAAQVTTAELTAAMEQMRVAAVGISPIFFADVSNARAADEARRLNDAITWLHRNAPRSDPATISPEYFRSLKSATELLSARPSPAVVRDVLEELEAKVAHCRALGVGMGGTVLLKVNTRRPGGPVSDWQVVYLLKIYENLQGAAPNNFPRLSTPTETAVEPGRYWVWARDPASGRTSDRSLVRVSGRKELLVDLPVP